jgi:hypothetical protein
MSYREGRKSAKGAERGKRFSSFSVKGSMTIDEIAELLVSAEGELLPAGNYVNRRGVLGYFMQVKCGAHWCKVSVSHVERHCDRTTAKELNEIDLKTLKPAVVIPAQSIADALKSSEGRRARLDKYENASGIEGLWTEFYFDGNWYMVSVSHIDLPARISNAELEMVADEFLSQQGNMKNKRRFRW